MLKEKTKTFRNTCQGRAALFVSPFLQNLKCKFHEKIHIFLQIFDVMTHIFGDLGHISLLYLIVVKEFLWHLKPLDVIGLLSKLFCRFCIIIVVTMLYSQKDYLLTGNIWQKWLDFVIFSLDLRTSDISENSYIRYKY